MRHNGLLQAELIGVLAALGHTDSVVIADAGLPVPNGPAKIDLAICPGTPSFIQLCSLVTAEIPVEAVTIAAEMTDRNPALYRQLLKVLEQLRETQGQNIEVRTVSHDILKQQSVNARAIVRSGEFSPFANMIIHAGVAF